MHNLIRTKFRQSSNYTQDMLVRDLIQLSQELEAIFNGFDAKDLEILGEVSSLDSRVTALEAVVDPALAGRVSAAEADIVSLKSRATSLEGRMNTAEVDINNLEAQDIALDSRLDVIELAIPALATRVTDLEGKFAKGTWTPRINFNGNNVGMTYTALRWGQWQRVDKFYEYNFCIQLTAKGSSVGGAYIDGFPIFGLTGFGTQYSIVGNFGYITGMTVDSGYHGWTMLGWTEVLTYGVRFQQVSAGGVGGANQNNITNNTFCMGRFSFILP